MPPATMREEISCPDCGGGHGSPVCPLCRGLGRVLIAPKPGPVPVPREGDEHRHPMTPNSLARVLAVHQDEVVFETECDGRTQVATVSAEEFRHRLGITLHGAAFLPLPGLDLLTDQPQ